MMQPSDLLQFILAIPDNEYNLAKLQEQIRIGSGVVPFIGAGLSVPFGFKSWSELLESAADVSQLLDEGCYEEAAEEIQKHVGDGEFNDLIEREFTGRQIRHQQQDAAVRSLARIFRGPVITTNFDHVLETVFEEEGNPFEEIVVGAQADREMVAMHGNRTVLLKIHGDAKRAESRILTRRQFEFHYGSSDPSEIDRGKSLPLLLDRMLSGRPALFLGCSLKQDRTMLILKSLSASAPDARHYAIMERPASESEFEARRRSLSDHHIRVVWFPSKGWHLIAPLLEYLFPVPFNTGDQKRLNGPNDRLLKPALGVFLGREDEVARVVTFLESREFRIYNVRGEPGIGKTEICKASLRAYLTHHLYSRAYYIDVSGAADEAGFLARLGTAWNFKNATGKEAVLAAIESAPGIIYIDNLEDILHSSLAWDVLKTLPTIEGVRVLVSSREVVPGASNQKIQPLPLDHAVELFIGAWNRTGGAIQINASGELDSFVLDELGCHALSIVLTAAQGYYVNSLTVLRDQWRKRRTALATLQGTSESKLTSLDVCIAESFKEVEREHQDAVVVWCTLALMPDGMSASARATMFGEQVAAFEVLMRLTVAEVTSNGTTRMLAPLRQFALLRMESYDDLREAVAARLYEYLFQLAKSTNAHRYDEQHIATLDTLLTEFSNIHAFVLFMSSRPDWIDRLSNLSWELYNFYQRRLLFGLEILDRISSMEEAGRRADRLPWTLQMMADIEREMDKFMAARIHCEAAIALHRNETSKLGLANALRGLAHLERRLSNFEAARSLYEEVVELYEYENDDLGRANSLRGLGDAERSLGRLDQAQIHLEEAIALYNKVLDHLGLATALRWLGDLYRVRNQPEDARDLYLKARDLCLSERSASGLAYSTCRLARVENALGNHAQARIYLAEAFDAAKQSQAPHALKRVREAAAEMELPDPTL